MIAAVTALVVLVSGCAKKTDGANRGGPTKTTDESGATEQLSGSITVSAAASLADVFDRIEADFVAAHPEVRISINYGSSGQLAKQIQEGAPVDVAAFADTVPMDTLADAGLLDGKARVFARNRLVIVTKAGNPTHIESVADLASAGVIALCNENAPCGKYAAEILRNAGSKLDESRVTRGQDARATLGAVSEGDAVAGIVYRTDAASVADKVAMVPIPEDLNVTADYPIAVLRDTRNAALARAFTDHVLSSQGRATLTQYGFVLP